MVDRKDEGILDKEIRIRADYQEIIERLTSLKNEDGEAIPQPLIRRLEILKDQVGR